MTKYLLIREDNTIEEVTASGYRDLQKFVGGLITSPWVGPDLEDILTVFANDEGILLGMEYNLLASMYLGQNLYGPVLIGGATDEDGEVTDVLEIIKDLLILSIHEAPTQLPTGMKRRAALTA